MLDSIVERINPATKKNLLLGSEIMAIEIVNLCPEKLNLVEDPKDLLISKSLKQLLVAGIPFRTGCEYIIPLQLNHATKFTIQGKDVISPRFFLAEFDSERVTAVRTVSVRELESEFYLPELVDGKLTAPKIKAKVASTGGWTVDKSSIVTPKVSTVTGALPVVDNNSRAQVIVATRLKYLGRVDGYTEKFIQTNGKWQLAVKDGFVELMPQRYHRFEVLGEVKDIQDVLTKMKSGTPECTNYLL